jgi:hypothetical protein
LNESEILDPFLSTQEKTSYGKKNGTGSISEKKKSILKHNVDIFSMLCFMIARFSGLSENPQFLSLCQLKSLDPSFLLTGRGSGLSSGEAVDEAIQYK